MGRITGLLYAFSNLRLLTLTSEYVFESTALVCTGYSPFAAK
jgi:hypothetical protein